MAIVKMAQWAEINANWLCNGKPGNKCPTKAEINDPLITKCCVTDEYYIPVNSLVGMAEIVQACFAICPEFLCYTAPCFIVYGSTKPETYLQKYTLLPNCSPFQLKFAKGSGYAVNMYDGRSKMKLREGDYATIWKYDQTSDNYIKSGTIYHNSNADYNFYIS